MLIENQNLSIQVREDLYELKQHGNLDYPIALYHVDSRQTQLELVHWHWHEEIEYILVTKGKARFFSGDTCHVLTEGQGMILNANVLHRTKAFENTECMYYSVVFHPSYIFDRQNPSLASSYLFPVTQNHRAPYLLFSKDDPTTGMLFDLLNKIITANQLQLYGYELMTKSLLIEAWLHILNILKTKDALPFKPAESSITNDEERIKNALTYISLHYADPISLQDISDAVHISKSECCRCFKRCLKITPFEYLIKYRIYSSVRLIMHTNHSVSDIAQETGFNSSSYFNKMFKKYIGCTPSSFRKKANADPQNTAQLLEGHIHPNDAKMLQNFL